MKKEREAASSERKTILMSVGMSRERRFQTNPNGQPYESIGPLEYSGFKKCLDDYIEGVEDNALPYVPTIQKFVSTTQMTTTINTIRNQGGSV